MSVTEEQLDAAARALARDLESMLQRVELVEVARSDISRPDTPQTQLEYLKRRHLTISREIERAEERLARKYAELDRLEYQIQRHRWQRRHESLDSTRQRSHDAPDSIDQERSLS